MTTSPNNYLTWAQVDLKAIAHNIRQLESLAARNKFYLPTRPHSGQGYPAQVLAVIKADAYGHGMKETAMLLNKMGVGFFAVSDVREGIRLREIGIKKPILLLESTLPVFVKDIVDHKLTPTVCSLGFANALNDYAKTKKRFVEIHVKVDTGMGRLGVWHEEAFDFIRKVHELNNLNIMGIYTHFPAADTQKSFTRKQIEKLYNLVIRLDKTGLVIPYIHAANSMGLAGYQTHVLNLSRPGLMIYGLYPDAKLKGEIALKPALSVHSKVIFIKKIEKGRSISYGRTFIAPRQMSVATIPLGYNDGYFRALSNKSFVIINGVKCPVVGRVTMDQIMVDATGVKNLRLGMPVLILGRQKNQEITADDLAQAANTINYEIVCSLGNRLPKIYR